MKFLILLLLCLPLLSNGQTALEKAKAHYESKKYVEASKLLDGVSSKDKDYAAARYYLGRIAFDKKEYDDAVDYFEEATEVNNKSDEYFTWLGDTYGTIAKDANVVRQGFLAPKMKSAWESAITLDSKNVNARMSLIQYYLQAPGFMGGSVDKAKEMAMQIMKITPALGHRSMGNIYYSEKKFNEAEKEYIEMVKADATFTPSLANFYMNQKQYDKAFCIFDESLKKNPSDMINVYQIGRTSAISGQQLDRGEKCLRQYLTYTPKENEPSHAGANMRLAQIFEKRGNKTEAKKLYETSLKQDNSLKESQEGLQRVSK
jgi:tetratricopeptide (TPR) repeat protein